MQTRSGRPSFVLLLVALCLGLAGVQVPLMLRNRQLSARVAELSELTRAAPSSEVDSLRGRSFPAQILVDADGGELALGELSPSHFTLLFVSALSCDYCEQAAPVWDRIARDLAGAPVRALGLVLDATPEQLRAGDTSYPLFAVVDAAALGRQLQGVPAAFLLDWRGAVVEAVYGGGQEGLEPVVRAALAGN